MADLLKISRERQALVGLCETGAMKNEPAAASAHSGRDPATTEDEPEMAVSSEQVQEIALPIMTFPHQNVETFFEVAIAHTPLGGRSEL